MSTKCESCNFYIYDEIYDDYVCDMDLDEDETARFITGQFKECPYFQMEGEYRIVKKQM